MNSSFAVVLAAFFCAASAISCKKGSPNFSILKDCKYNAQYANGTTASMPINCCMTVYSGPTVTMDCAGANDGCEEKCYRHSPAFSTQKYMKGKTCYCKGENCNNGAAAFSSAVALSLVVAVARQLLQ